MEMEEQKRKHAVDALPSFVRHDLPPASSSSGKLKKRTPGRSNAARGDPKHCPKHWHRDANAARNILEAGLVSLRGEPINASRIHRCIAQRGGVRRDFSEMEFPTVYETQVEMVATPLPSRSFREVIGEDWVRILLASVVVILVFGGVDVLGKMHPESAWPGIIAGVPTGLLSAYFVSNADMISFLQNYSQTSLCLTIVTVIFALVVASRGAQGSHQYIPLFIFVWFLLTAGFIL